MGTAFEGKMIRFALSLVVAFVMAFALTPCAGLEKALADDAAGNRMGIGKTQVTSQDYPLWVGETQVTSENLAGDGWSFDPATNTLTLDGFSYKGVGHAWYDEEKEGYRHAPIFWVDGNRALTIELKGENSVTTTAGPIEDDTHFYHAVFSAAGLTFRGTGSLVANAGDIVHGDGIERLGYGICATKDLKVESGSISGRGIEVGIESSEGMITIGKDAGTIAAEGADEDAFAGIDAETGVKIDGGTVTAKGYYGIHAGGDIVVNGGDVSAQSVLPEPYLGSIMKPSGIHSFKGTVTINGGTVVAKGYHFGIGVLFDADDDEEDEEDEEGEEDDLGTQAEGAAQKANDVPDSIVINGGTVIAEAYGIVGESASECDDISGIGANGYGTVTIKGGSVKAIGGGDNAFGIYASNSITIGEKTAALDAAGTSGAFGKDTNVKNAVPGTGFTDVEGTQGKAAIEANASGQKLNNYKRAVFPGGAATVVTPPSGKTLTYNGKPQELVTAGTAEGGEMRYSLDGKTYDAKLPSATKAGKYTIYYKVVGDASHTDSEAKTVESVINESSSSSSSSSSSAKSSSSSSSASTAKTGNSASTAKSSLAKTGDVVAIAVPVVLVIVALVAAVIALVARKRKTE